MASGFVGQVHLHLGLSSRSEDLVESWTRTKGSGPDSCDLDPWFPSAAHPNRGLTSLRFSTCSLHRIGCFRHPNVSGDFRNRGPKTVIYRRLATSITNRVDRLNQCPRYPVFALPSRGLYNASEEAPGNP